MRELGVADSGRLHDGGALLEADSSDAIVLEIDPAAKDVYQLKIERVPMRFPRLVRRAARADDVRPDASFRRFRDAEVPVREEPTQPVAPARIARMIHNHHAHRLRPPNGLVLGLPLLGMPQESNQFRGMALVAMDWKDGKPPADFVGFAIEYKEPHGDPLFAVNRVAFPGAGDSVDQEQLSRDFGRRFIVSRFQTPNNSNDWQQDRSF